LELYSGDKRCARANLAPNGEKIVTHISNFRKLKRTQDVIAVFAGIHKSIPSKLVLVGDGPERQKAEQLAEQLGVRKDVIYLGKTTEVERVLCASDLFLLTSESESFGLVALEAMAAKVPVISTNAGGIPEVNVHGETGFITNVGDVDTMIEHSVALLSNQEEYQAMSERAYEQAKRFDLSKILPQYEQLYQEISAVTKE
jgi:N-acetyl-alpha-D-glucosaminyl L-malate synthase BshA